MKSRINIFLGTLAAFALGFSSCKGLDVNPNGFYSEDNFYNTVEDAQAALYYAYDGLTYNSYTQGVMYFSELASDNADVKLDEGADAVQIMNWEVTNQNEFVLQFYRSLYIAINRANAVIENVPGRGFSQEDENRLLGEAYFLRAFNHFYAVRTYGLVPLQRSLIDKLDETNASLPTNMQEVYTFLIEDAMKAADLLKVNRSIGRADQVAAQALLAKIYLFAASAKESGVPLYDQISTSVDDLYANAALYAKKVLTEQTEYSHEPNLLSIYNVEDTRGKELIFTSSFDRSGVHEGDYSALSKYYVPYISGSAVYLKNTDGSFSPTHDGWSVVQPTTAIKFALGDTDKRRTELLIKEVFDKDGNSAASVSGGTLQYEFSRKFIDSKFEGDKTSTRPFYLRYSDVQLMYAEAAADADGLVQLNQIRTRAGVALMTDAEFTAMSKADFRNAVIDERQKELAFEWDRLWDLRRKNMVQTKVSAAAGLTPEQLAFYPIPQREIDLNPNFKP